MRKSPPPRMDTHRHRGKKFQLLCSEKFQQNISPLFLFLSPPSWRCMFLNKIPKNLRVYYNSSKSRHGRSKEPAKKRGRKPQFPPSSRHFTGLPFLSFFWMLSCPPLRHRQFRDVPQTRHRRPSRGSPRILLRPFEMRCRGCLL